MPRGGLGERRGHDRRVIPLHDTDKVVGKRVAPDQLLVDKGRHVDLERVRPMRLPRDHVGQLPVRGAGLHRSQLLPVQYKMHRLVDSPHGRIAIHDLPGIDERRVYGGGYGHGYHLDRIG